VKTSVTAIYLLDGGTLTVESSIVTAGQHYGQLLTVPVQMFLVDTTNGFLLVDSGNDPAVIDDPVAAWGDELANTARPRMERRHHLAEQLSLLGLEPGDITAVVYTHLHHDHAGGGRLFDCAEHVVQRAEHRWAGNPDPGAARGYVTTDLAGVRNWRFLDGDCTVRPGVQAISTPGHSPGHQSVVLWDVPALGTVILAGDAINTQECRSRGTAPGLATDALAALDSTRRLISLAEATDAWLIVGHDLAQFEKMPKAPQPITRTDESSVRGQTPDLEPRAPGRDEPGDA
jgi:glyoxylase-like metal-dependent hydrolase (beta-lactamase superfamily II)